VSLFESLTRFLPRRHGGHEVPAIVGYDEECTKIFLAKAKKTKRKIVVNNLWRFFVLSIPNHVRRAALELCFLHVFVVKKTLEGKTQIYWNSCKNAQDLIDYKIIHCNLSFARI